MQTLCVWPGQCALRVFLAHYVWILLQGQALCLGVGRVPPGERPQGADAFAKGAERVSAKGTVAGVSAHGAEGVLAAAHGVASDTTASITVPPAAVVLPSVGEHFKDGLTAEFLRFVTAYGRGFDVLVDLTPYSPLLRTAADISDHVSMYAFIDTWVGNDTGGEVVYVSNSTGTCHTVKQSHGNGWMLDAELLFWNTTGVKATTHMSSTMPAVVDMHPYSSVTLASGPTGGIYSMGATSIHEGYLTPQDAVILDKPAIFEETAHAYVYECSGQEEIRQAAVFGHILNEFTSSFVKQETTWIDFIQERLYNYIAMPYLRKVTIQTVEHGKQLVVGTYDRRTVVIEAGTPVFISPYDAFTDKLYGDSFWSNASYPLVAVGTVIEISQTCEDPSDQVWKEGMWTEDGQVCIATATLSLDKLDVSCLPDSDRPDFPGLFVPVNAQALPHAKQLALNMRKQGEAAAAAAQQSSSTPSGPTAETGPVLLKVPPEKSEFVLVPERRVNNLKAVSASAEHGTQPLSLLRKGRRVGQSPNRKHWNMGMKSLAESIDEGTHTHTGPASDQPLNATHLHHHTVQNRDFDHVCVLTQQPRGRFFNKHFEMPALRSGNDKAILQLSITGHGWEATTESCGEYCHALYRLRINGKSVGNITQWRDDCSRNPLGEQDGTWKTSRNGWCPGSVQPGLFIDVTRWLTEGANVLTMDVSVRSSVTGKYGPYIDHSGFSQQEAAVLNVASTLFVYDEAAVQAIRAQTHASTPAEEALRKGSSDPKALVSKDPAVLESMGAMHQQPQGSGDIRQSVSTYFDRLWRRESMGETHQQQPSLGDFSAYLHRFWRGIVSIFHKATATLDSSASASTKMHSNYAGPLDFQARAPWNLLDEADIPKLSDAFRVQAFSGKLIQGQNRWNTERILKAALPQEWRSVALRLRLYPPSHGLTVDAWDRVGSFGIHIGEQAAQQL